MRNKTKKNRPPANVLQFHKHRPKTKALHQMTRKKRRSEFLIIAGGLIGGGLLGYAALHGLGFSPSWSQVAVATNATSLCIANVHDGDTIRTCEGERVRIENIDAPEMLGSPKCTDRRRNGWCDYELARQSRDALDSLLASGPVSISRSGTDKYGRTLATLSVNGQDAGRYLVSLGLARPWR